MTTFLANVEAALVQLAKNASVNKGDVHALTHQWVHALCSNSNLCGNVKSDEVVEVLRDAGLYKTHANFKKCVYTDINFPPPNVPAFSFIDLFAGIGGFRVALQKLKGVCVFSSEWDKAAQRTYLNNYGELPFGDITSFTAETISDTLLDSLIPDHDVLAGGFPCQPFSHAGVSARNAVGKEHGFKCDTQGTLFFDIMRIAAVKRPKVLFLENVRNIERHDGGRTFAVIKQSIEELGYDFKYQVIDASSLVPQRRLRCYMVCFRKDLRISYGFPSFEGDALPLKSILEPYPEAKFTISDKLWLGHQNRTQRNLDRGTGFTAHLADLEKPSNTLVARYGKDGKECLVPQGKKNPRLLTPRECARLQGYPESFLIPEARTTAYRQFGNSVAVPVVTRISKSIVKAFK
jgi:DNA (cytosine-5)-methyltransferase 1